VVNGFNSYKYAVNETNRLRFLKSNIKSIMAVGVYALALPVCSCLGVHTMVNCLQKGAYHFSRVCAMMGIELWKKRDF
jgi:hypothetical protein